MTNKEIFMMVFGKNPENLKQKASNIEWWDQEFIGQPDCDDAISRKAVLDIDFKRIILTTAKPAEMIEQKVKALPPVTPQPKMGHWILTSDDDYEYCTCSECGYQNGENWMIGSHIKFCQECGARMVEPQEDKE